MKYDIPLSTNFIYGSIFTSRTTSVFGPNNGNYFFNSVHTVDKHKCSLAKTCHKYTVFSLMYNNDTKCD